MDSGRELGFLGILFRAGKLTIGSRIETSLRRGVLLVKAKDTDSGESRRLLSKAASRSIPVYEAPYGKAELGRALGREEVSLALLTDKKALKGLGKENA